MAVNSETISPGRMEIGFPKIMRHNNLSLIVLFNSKKAGVVIFSREIAWNVGDISNDGWNIANFHDYKGSVSLSNLT